MKFTSRGDASLLWAEPVTSTEPTGAVAGAQRLMCRLPFANLSSALLGASSRAPPPVQERRTGTLFSGDYCLREGQRNCPIITGAG